MCTDVSGLGLAEQARVMMHPSPLKKEEELAEYVEMWQDKMRRVEAHGEDHDRTTATKTYDELLEQGLGLSRRRKLDTTPKERTRQGGETMDVGVGRITI